MKTPASIPLRVVTRRRRRLGWWTVVIGVVVVFAVVHHVYRWATFVPPTVVRAMIRNELAAIAQVFAVYQQEFGALPELATLERMGWVTRRQRRPFQAVVYRDPDAADRPRLVVVQRLASPLIHKGEPTSEPGDPVDRDLPAVRVVMFEDLRVAEVDEAEFQRQYVPLLRAPPVADEKAE
ncbi:MAG: hypothetical protein AB7Q17_18360 [Phycisphaerae bacterium]